MSTFDNRLLESGFKSIGLCSSLWIGSDGSFRAGFYLYQGRLHLVLRIDENSYYINEVKRELVEICLRGGLSIYDLATGSRAAIWWQGAKMCRATILHRIRLWWCLQTSKFLPLPNYYYLWNEYIYHA